MFSLIKLEKQLVFLFIVMMTVGLLYSNLLWRFDNFIYDAQLKLLASPPSDEIIIIEVDEKSLNMLGRWPWSRSVHAELIDRLATVDTYGVGLNFIFAEPSLNPHDDAMLAKAMANHGKVVLPLIVEQGELSLIETLPLADYTRVAILGHANVPLGEDGISRSVFLKAGLNQPNWPSMALALYGLKHPESLKEIPGRRHPIPSLPFKQYLTGDHQAWLPFYSPDSDFQRVSYVDVLLNRVPASHFENKYVLVGLSAGGLDHDISTPLFPGNHPMTGTDYIATILDGLIKDSIWQPAPQPWQFIASIVAVSLALLLYSTMALNWALLSSALLSFVLIVLGSLTLQYSHYWFPPSAALFSIIIIYPVWSWKKLESLLRALFLEKSRALVTLNSIVDGVMTVDTDNVIDYLNPAIINMLNATETEIREDYQNHRLMLVSASGERSLAEIVAHGIANNDERQFLRCELKKSTETPLTVNLHISPLYDNRNRYVGTVLTVQDIREIMEMTRQLIAQNKEQNRLKLEAERARQANLAKSEFLSRMSHELRTPLNAILGFGQLMEMDDDDEYPLSEENLDFIGEILNAGEHLLGLINELLDLAKIESGKIELEIGNVLVQDIVKDCMTLIMPMARKHEIEMIDETEGLLEQQVRADNKRSKQILLNFLSNAIKYNRENGRVTLHLEKTETTMRFLVTDTGKGLTLEQQGNLFKSFERLGAHKTNIEGTGIGLVITKQLAEMMQGNVGVESEVGKGSTFWMELPLVDNVESYEL